MCFSFHPVMFTVAQDIPLYALRPVRTNYFFNPRSIFISDRISHKRDNKSPALIIEIFKERYIGRQFTK